MSCFALNNEKIETINFSLRAVAVDHVRLRSCWLAEGGAAGMKPSCRLRGHTWEGPGRSLLTDLIGREPVVQVTPTWFSTLRVEGDFSAFIHERQTFTELTAYLLIFMAQQLVSAI